MSIQTSKYTLYSIKDKKELEDFEMENMLNNKNAYKGSIYDVYRTTLKILKEFTATDKYLSIIYEDKERLINTPHGCYTSKKEPNINRLLNGSINLILKYKRAVYNSLSNETDNYDRYIDIALMIVSISYSPRNEAFVEISYDVCDLIREKIQSDKQSIELVSLMKDKGVAVLKIRELEEQEYRETLTDFYKEACNNAIEGLKKKGIV